MTQFLLGVDVGTTNIKTGAFTLDGDLVYLSRAKNPVRHPEPKRAEQDMVSTWEATVTTIREVTAKLGENVEIAGVGTTGQAHGCWMIDENGKPVRDAIIWSDSRATKYIDQWDEDGSLSRLIEICGSSPYSGMSLPILKWIAEHNFEALAAADTVFSCKDWIKYKLTNTRTTDVSEVSVPYLNMSTNTPNEEVFEIVGLQAGLELLPNIVSPTEVVGHVSSMAEEMTGVPEGTPVVGGVIDNIASAFGSGVSSPSDSSVIIGTSIITQSLLEASSENRETFEISTGIENMSMAVVGSRVGTQSLDWAREELADGADYDSIVSKVKEVPVGSEGVRYLPFLSSTGEDGSFVNPHARAQFIGLEPSHSIPNLLRSVYEGVALAMKDCYDRTPTNAGRVHISGGGSRSKFWTQMFSDCLDTEVVVPETNEPGAKGAALLAGTGVGIYTDIREAVDQTTTKHRVHTPQQMKTAQYSHLFELFLNLVDHMEEVWQMNQSTKEELQKANL